MEKSMGIIFFTLKIIFLFNFITKGRQIKYSNLNIKPFGSALEEVLQKQH